MVKKFKVSFEAETDDQGFTHAPHETTRQYAEGADGFLIGVPLDAEITEIKPQFEAGWYRFLSGDPYQETSYWSEQDFVDYGDASRFIEKYQRMNPPTPYEESKYKDGYYRMSDGYEYRREAGRWYCNFVNSDGWVTSSYNDDTIEDDHSVVWERPL